MVKIIWTTMATVILLIGLCIFEHFLVKNEFNEFENSLVILYEKIEDKTAKKIDGENVQKIWYNKKEKLHSIIPHNNIAHIVNWLSEAVNLIETKNYDFALSKIEVLIENCKQIPATYTLNFENIF